MTILHLSDTHNFHHQLRDLPEADVIVHSGDFTQNGSEAEVIDFLEWFCKLPYRHKIFICGNHDDSLFGTEIEGLDENVHYLCNSGVIIHGMKFYGVPMFLKDTLTNIQGDNYRIISVDTDVLITHSPPYGILDSDEKINYGSEELLLSVTNIAPQLHLFGHIHRQYGIIKLNGTLLSNGSIIRDEDFSLKCSHSYGNMRLIS